MHTSIELSKATFSQGLDFVKMFAMPSYRTTMVPSVTMVTPTVSKTTQGVIMKYAMFILFKDLFMCDFLMFQFHVGGISRVARKRQEKLEKTKIDLRN